MRLVLDERFTRRDAMEQAYLSRMQKMNYEWYPPSWFTFLAMGRPAGLQYLSALFNSGIATKELADGLGPQEAAASLGGRTARKRHYAQLGQSMPDRPPLTPAGTVRRRSGSGSSSSNVADEINSGRIVIALLEKEIAMAESFSEDVEHIQSLKRELYAAVSDCRKKAQQLHMLGRCAVFSTPSPTSNTEG